METPLPWRTAALAVCLHVLAGSSPAFAQCPSNQSWRLAPGTYHISFQGTFADDSTLQADIQRALNIWNAANEANGVGVRFTTGAGLAGTITFVGEINPNYQGLTQPTGSDENHYVDGGTTHIATHNNLSRGPEYPGDYHGAITKTGVHELGHWMGLDDVGIMAQQPGASVMNFQCGPNDSDGCQASGPTACDNQKVKERYPSGPGPGPGGRPAACIPCRVYHCERVEDSREGPYPECHYEFDQCCRTDAAAASESQPCAGWLPAQQCEFGSICCVDPAVAYAPPGCDSKGWWEQGSSAQCDAACGAACGAEWISVLDRYTGVPASTRACVSCGPGQGPSCGAIGGDYCGSGGCPAGYDSLGGTYDCNPCCKSQPPPDPGPSCGAIGGDYCGSGGCPAGYDSLGGTYDCNPCCKSQPPPDPGPSCGAIGGDYCGSGGCPGGYDSLGETYDCSPCCKSRPQPCYDTCYNQVCDTDWQWVDDWCESCNYVCDTCWSCYYTCGEYDCWEECSPYECNCRDECGSYVCGGHWEPFEANCRQEPYECNPHPCP
jgi:hypothetical protein